MSRVRLQARLQQIGICHDLPRRLGWRGGGCPGHMGVCGQLPGHDPDKHDSPGNEAHPPTPGRELCASSASEHVLLDLHFGECPASPLEDLPFFFLSVWINKKHNQNQQHKQYKAHGKFAMGRFAVSSPCLVDASLHLYGTSAGVCETGWSSHPGPCAPACNSNMYRHMQWRV